MDTKVLSLIARSSNHFYNKYRFKLITSTEYNETLFNELYILSNRLITEDYDHWKSHAITNQFLHLVQDKTQNNKTVGFQFFRLIETQSLNHSLLFGGKLRYDLNIRGMGINLISNVEICKMLKSELFGDDPDHIIYRVGLFNIFGYLSVIDSLDKHKYFIYPFNENQECQTLITPILNNFCRENGFDTDNITGLVNVKQTIPNETISSLHDSFWKKPKVTEYITFNPNWKDGWDIYVSWELDEYNINSMLIKGWDRYANKNQII